MFPQRKYNPNMNRNKIKFAKKNEEEAQRE
jgi:hypothetical protein